MMPKTIFECIYYAKTLLFSIGVREESLVITEKASSIKISKFIIVSFISGVFL